MNRYLQYYLEDGFFLRIKNVVLTDHYIGENATLHLALKPVDGYEHEASFFDRFDRAPGELVLKIENDSLDKQQAIVRAFEQYLSELSPATILFNKAGFLEIDDHNGHDQDEGWLSWFGNFDYKAFELYSDRPPVRDYERSTERFHVSSALLGALRDKKIALPADNPVAPYKFARLMRLLTLCVNESAVETIAFLDGYFLKRPDMDWMYTMHGEEFGSALRIAGDIVSLLRKGSG